MSTMELLLASRDYPLFPAKNCVFFTDTMNPFLTSLVPVRSIQPFNLIDLFLASHNRDKTMTVNIGIEPFIK